MRKLYIDNIRWITVVLVVLYHVIYMFNGIETFGVIGPFSDVQYQDAFQYIVYPWFMLLLFVISGMSARYELEHRSEKEFIKKDGKIIGSIHPWAFSVLVDFRILQSADRRWIRSRWQQFQNRFYLSSWQSVASDRYGISRCYVFSVLLIWVRRVEKDRLWKLGEKANVPFLVLFAIVIWGAAQILNTPMIVVYRFGIYGVDSL